MNKQKDPYNPHVMSGFKKLSPGALGMRGLSWQPPGRHHPLRSWGKAGIIRRRDHQALVWAASLVWPCSHALCE